MSPETVSQPLLSLYLSLPLWPLLAVVGIGLLLATRRGIGLADKFAVIGVGITAVLAVTLFFHFQTLGHDTSLAEPHAQAAGVSVHTVADPHAAGADGEKKGAPASKKLTADDYTPPHTLKLANWISLGVYEAADGSTYTQWIDLNFVIDRLTSIMLLFVCVVSTMVVIYAIGYMRDHHGHKEVGYERFFAFLALFVFSMSVLVLSGNFVLLYLGWEAVGLCSYLLIGFYFRKPEAAAAAKKAFLVNRIGDFGFALGIFAIYFVLAAPLDPSQSVLQPGENVLDYATVFKYAEHIGEQTLFGINAATVISLLLFCGAIGKSAQFPLYVWLPDAMEGPTPVSALIHAATMVTAGVYLVARCMPLFVYADPIVFDIILAVGLIGAVLAATMALAQYDMKRILAYSTISQLAYMFVALGCFVPMSAVFHVYTHAFFKALLFLTAGSVMHAMGGVIDLRQFGGLRRTLPTTHIQMLIGCAALAGVPLLAGFWSKDEIVHAAFIRAPWVGWVMTATAGLTAFYTFRMFFLCFNGPRRLPEEAGTHPHEMPPVMTAPLWLLAVGAVLAGYLGVTFVAGDFSTAFAGVFQPHGLFHDFLHAGSTVINKPHAAGDVWIMYVSGAVALGGILLAYGIYGRGLVADPGQSPLGALWHLLYRKYYVDEIYHAVFVRPLRWVGDVCFAVDRWGLDGLVWFVSAVPRGLGATLKLTQRGALQGYALFMVIGLVLILWLWHALTPALAAGGGN